MKRLHPVALPLVFGLLAGVAFWYVPVPDKGGSPHEATAGSDHQVANATPAGAVWVFAQGPTTRDDCNPPESARYSLCSGPVVLVAPRADGPALPAPGTGTPYETSVAWRPRGAIGLVDTSDITNGVDCARGCPPDPRNATAPWIIRFANSTERFGEEGHNAARLTFYAFNDQGEALAGNAPDLELSRFPLYGDFIGLSPLPWYFGANATPEGMYRPPTAARDLVDDLVPHLRGIPEGGVATLVLERHAYAWLTGPLTLTARVDDVIHAP